MKKIFGMFVIFLLLVGCNNETNKSAMEPVTNTEEELADTDKKETSITESETEGDNNTAQVEEIEEVNINTTEELEVEKENAVVENKREEYMKKLNEVEKGLAEFKEVLKNGTQLEMTQAQAEILSRWDALLNEIYGVLENQLSTSDMDKLREEQREWIKYRDLTAKEAALKFEGGTMETLEYISTQAIITEERCYDLVEGYME
ncbi:lysozyme inhibitor LprI family protein [Metabacillus sp. FJAT-53654]|uniref:Lysozyme inhibitor LprI family protein n=1 Tax=Metabacillus rhizosphaerae TaxID=3117747 RepID=A0ABZ2MME3_9BACI